MMIFAVTALLVAGILGGFGVLPAHAATAPSLGTAAPFAVLAGSGITNTGTTTITGNVGSFPTSSETGFSTVTITGANNIADAGTQTDLNAAIAVAQGNSPTTIGISLDTQTLVPGVYTSGTAFTLSGVLTLNGAGVYIFQAPQAIAGALSTVGGSVVLENGAQACNVFWVTSAGGATIGSGTTFVGTIMAYSSITLGSGSSLQGAALASVGDVTMNNNNIAVTPCATQSTTTSASAPVNTPGANCATGIYYGYYTNSTTQQQVQFQGLAIGAAVKLITNNPPGALICQTPAITAILPKTCAYLTIITVSANGTTLSGLYSDVWSNSGPIAGCIPNNTTFTAGVFDSGCYMFSHWSDTGSSQRFRAFSMNANTTFVAVYNNVCAAMPATSSMISVSAVISPNTPTTGYYATLWQNGAMVQSCFTGCSFMVSNGQTYQVAISDFGAHTFSHWSNGSTSRFITVNVGANSTTIALTAIYS